jgi:hypothetical protein
LGWIAEEKRRETFDKEARFLICFKEVANSSPGSNSRIAGFGMFRFEGDDQGPDGLIEDVVYW